MAQERLAALDIKRLEVILTRVAIAHFRKIDSPSKCPLQSEVLILIYENGGSMVQKDLESALEIRKSTLSGILNTMAKSGLIEKSDSSTDQRSKVISLTEKAKGAHDEAVHNVNELEKMFTEGITEEEMEVFFRVVDRMKSNLLDEE